MTELVAHRKRMLTARRHIRHSRLIGESVRAHELDLVQREKHYDGLAYCKMAEGIITAALEAHTVPAYLEAIREIEDIARDFRL